MYIEKMVERDVLISTKVRHVGLFDFKETYRILFEWFIDQGFDFNEKSYKEVAGAGGAKELEIEWECVRKVSDYFKFYIKTVWKIIGMTSVEVEVDGVKQKMNKGDLTITFSSVLLKDYEEKWSKTPFLNFLRTLYDRYLIKERITAYEMKLITEMEQLVAQAKSFLALTGRR
jgi:hypothetical protein